MLVIDQRADKQRGDGCVAEGGQPPRANRRHQRSLPSTQKGQPPKRLPFFASQQLATGAGYEVFFISATSASSIEMYAASLDWKAFVYSCSVILAFRQSPSKE